MTSAPRRAGLPDGLVSNQSFGTFWKAFELEILISFVTIWNSLWQFALFHVNMVPIRCGHLLYYPHFGILYREKSGNPASLRNAENSSPADAIISFAISFSLSEDGSITADS
jgi:hypothetical protein